MTQEEVVNETPVEQTIETDSTPVEATQATSESQETAEIAESPTGEESPASESTEPAKVSETVPYERFKEVLDKSKSLEEKVNQILSQQAPQTTEDVPELDPDAARAVEHLLNQKLEAKLAEQKVAEFRSKHGAKLDKDEMLSIAVEREMRKQSQEGRIIDPEKALADAERLLSERMKPATEQAKAEGVKEGQDVAKTKQQLNAVGNPAKIEEVGDDKLSSAELAAKYNIPRV